MIEPEAFPKKLFAEALEIGDLETIEAMFTVGDTGELKQSLERYKTSLEIAQGDILYAELGWQQFRKVPAVALVRRYPESSMEDALSKWCGLEYDLEDMSDTYEYQILYINNRPCRVHLEESVIEKYVFLTNPADYNVVITYDDDCTIYTLKRRESIAWEESSGGILAFSNSREKDLAKWKRGTTEFGRRDEHTLLSYRLLGEYLGWPIGCLEPLVDRQRQHLDKLIKTNDSIQTVIQNFYTLSYKESDGGECEPFPAWQCDVHIPPEVLFYKRLSENCDLDFEYTSEEEFREHLKSLKSLNVCVDGLKKTWAEERKEVKDYLDLIITKKTLDAPLTWNPYEEPIDQLLACLLVLHYLSPSKIHQTRSIAKYGHDETETLNLILDWAEDPTVEKIKHLGEILEFKDSKDAKNLPLSLVFHKVIPVVPEIITDSFGSIRSGFREELRLVKAKGDKYGLLFCNRVLQPPGKIKAARHFAMSNVDDSDQLEVLTVKLVEELPEDYIGQKNNGLHFSKFSFIERSD